VKEKNKEQEVMMKRRIIRIGKRSNAKERVRKQEELMKQWDETEGRLS